MADPGSDNSLRCSRRAVIAVGTGVAGALVGAPLAGRHPQRGAEAASTRATRRPRELIRIETIDPGRTPAQQLVAVPQYVLLETGQMITMAPSLRQTPEPAIPGMLSALLSTAGIERMLTAARTADLVETDATIANPNDDTSPTILITVRDGATSVVTAVRGLDSVDAEMSPGIAERWSEINAFIQVTREPASLKDDGTVIEPEHVFAFDRLQLVAMPAATAGPEPGTPAATAIPAMADIRWPFASPIQEFGVPLTEARGATVMVEQFPGARAAVVTNPALIALRPLLAMAAQSSIWNDGTSRWTVLFRPMLPGEIGNLARVADD